MIKIAKDIPGTVPGVVFVFTMGPIYYGPPKIYSVLMFHVIFTCFLKQHQLGGRFLVFAHRAVVARSITSLEPQSRFGDKLQNLEF